MQSIDIAEKLRELGGRLVTDRDGDFWRFHRGEFIVEVEPFKFNEKWGFDCSLEHRGFAELVNRISGAERSEFVCIKWFQLKQKDDESLASAVTDMLSAATSPALTDYISTLLSHIPEKSVPQLCHIAALAMEGDFTTLMEYQEDFKKGKRRNFVPLVKIEMIERAIDIALEMAP